MPRSERDGNPEHIQLEAVSERDRSRRSSAQERVTRDGSVNAAWRMALSGPT